MESHEERAAEMEFELADMEERSDKLADEIEDAKADVVESDDEDDD